MYVTLGGTALHGQCLMSLLTADCANESQNQPVWLLAMVAAAKTPHAQVYSVLCRTKSSWLYHVKGENYNASYNATFELSITCASRLAQHCTLQSLCRALLLPGVFHQGCKQQHLQLLKKPCARRPVRNTVQGQLTHVQSFKEQWLVPRPRVAWHDDTGVEPHSRPRAIKWLWFYCATLLLQTASCRGQLRKVAGMP